MTLVPVNNRAEVEQRAGALFHGRYVYRQSLSELSNAITYHL